MGGLLTIGETMGVAVTEVGDPLRTARTLRLSTAGAESTVAIGMSRLGHRSVWVGVLGDDELGARVRRDLAAEGVDTRFARTDPGRPTGFMLRELRTAEYTRVSYYRQHSAGAQLSAADVEAAMAANPGLDLVHLTGITPALGESCADAVRTAVELARGAGIAVSFDVNYRSTLPNSGTVAGFVGELLPRIDVLFSGDDELALLTGEADPRRAARELAGHGPSEVVVKRGADGAVAATADGDEAAQSALPVRVADAVGAGDSFTAGYLAARCEGLPLPDRLHWAVTAAACTVGTHGDWEGLPSRAEIERRLAAPTTVR